MILLSCNNRLVLIFKFLLSLQNLFDGLSFSALFPDVVNCMQTDNLELKKLVYLYLMNYAKSQPDMAIMAVNTFVKVIFGVSEWIISNNWSLCENHFISVLFLTYITRTVRIPILLFEPWPSELWAAFALTRSPSICASH